jgi:predicted permease
MAIVIAALLPVFLLIVLGFVLKRSLMRLETQWHGLERLTYYVLFPAPLIDAKSPGKSHRRDLCDRWPAARVVPQ